MSRTIRRTRDKRRNDSGRSHFDHHWTHDWVRFGSTWKSVKLEGKEFDKAYWRFHSDRVKRGWSYSKTLRAMFEKTTRAQNRQELVRYYQNSDYEVMTHKTACLSWED
jgi:hypothetical protein